MKKVELLAPAGSVEKAKVAFMYGADAVYAGTAKLSLRSRADMDIDTLEETIEYAHSIGKKVYVALNIYARDEDYAAIEKEVMHLRDIQADAIILADGGILDVVKKIAPQMEIHISTQANSVSLQTAKFWRSLGAKRVILSRELTKAEMQYIMKNKPEDLECEMFIHGAICYAYSGRCYLSKYLNGRCANHGDCAQPCRWEYQLFAREKNHPDSVIELDADDHGTYIFSSKDMCLIKQIPDICKMGMESLKIEGRLKTDYYLACVVRAYRQAIDAYYADPDNFSFDVYLEELMKVKTRGLSEFYFTDSNNLDIQDYEGQSDNLDYEYGAKVTNVTDSLITVEIKNKLCVGDTLEVLSPDNMDLQRFVIEDLYDVFSQERVDHVNPGVKGQSIKLKIPFAVKEGYIIRRKK
ncbi:MAG: U32 family peptidase [Clostridia bacterium]